MIIAIDGPAASGKGTLGRRLARHYNYNFLDTGLLYRAVAREMVVRGLDLLNEDQAEEIARTLDANDVMRKARELVNYGSDAAQVAASTKVRQALVQVQRTFAAAPPGAVLDGRDIGTVICPDADVKIFVTATPQVRAQRRAREFAAAGNAVAEADILADILRRDARDMGRAVAPLKKADDAHEVDTTALDIEQAVAAAVAIVERARAAAPAR